MFIKISTRLFMLMLLLLPFSVRSQTNTYFGPHLGIQNSQDAQDANYLVGATLRLKLSPVIGLEGDIGYRQVKYGSGALTARDWPFTVTGLIYPFSALYGGVGGGWYNTTLDYAEQYNDAGIDDKTTRNFGWHLVAGLEFPASPNINLFGDIRYAFLDSKFENLPGAVLDGAKADFYSINIGMLFQL